MKNLSWAAVLAASLLVIACSPSEQQADPGSPAIAAPSYQSADGATIYQQVCAACHANGVAGAPAVGDKEAWRGRINQGMATLIEHATEGFRGTRGFMPARGGHSTLSDEELRAAVEFMVNKSR